MARTIRVQQGGALRRRRGEDPRPGRFYPLIRRAARAALADQGIDEAELSLTLLDDSDIARMNARFLGRDAPTDVIAFALFEDGEAPVGDVYLGYDQVRRHAAAGRVPLHEEIARVTIHGVLHVLGYEHPEDARRNRSRMWRVQERIVAALERS
jgi:probable rRNA maturation factor